MLALQRAIGNRATRAILQRSEVTTGSGAVVRFRIGLDVDLSVVYAAWERTERGPLDDWALALLHERALLDDTVDDNERMFIAALLDPDNARRWHAPATVPLVGQTIEFPVDSITAARRRKVQDLGRSTLAVPTRPHGPGGSAAALDAQIVALAGPFAAAAQTAIAIADEARVPHLTLYFAMLNGASDSTPGDRAFAGAVYAISRRERLAEAADIAAGRVKVDQVRADYLPTDAAGMYQPEATRTGRKGDTLYLPSGIDFATLEAQATVVHELTHTGQDIAAKSRRTLPVVDAELPAFRAEAAFLIGKIKTRSGPARVQAVEHVGREIGLPTLYCMLLEAAEVAVDDAAIAVVEEAHAEVMRSGDAAMARAFGADALRSFVDGFRDDERHYGFAVALVERARKAIADSYMNISPAPDGGLKGESVLDAP